MKNLYSITLIIFCIAFTQCKTRNNSEAIQPASDKGFLTLHLHSVLDSLEIETLDSVYSLSDGKKISVSKAALYISSIMLVKADGSLHPVEGNPILVTTETELYKVGKVPAGNYSSVKFDVGLSVPANTTAPIASDTVLYQPEMWFGKTVNDDGFVFVNFAGKVGFAGKPMQDFKYRIGTRRNMNTLQTASRSFSIIPNNTFIVHLNVNYAKLFSGIDISQKENLMVTTPLDNASSLAQKIASNISMMFEYEE
jgi:hypothetical protein